MSGASSQGSGGGMYAATGEAAKKAVPKSPIITIPNDNRNLKLLPGLPSWGTLLRRLSIPKYSGSYIRSLRHVPEFGATVFLKPSTKQTRGGKIQDALKAVKIFQPSRRSSMRSRLTNSLE